MSPATKRRWPRFSLRTMLLATVALGIALAWATAQWKWMRDRTRARAWLGASKQSWYAPSMGGKLQVDAPWSVHLLGEDGIVGIGLDVNEYTGPVPYSPDELKRLFPEARIEFSRNGVWVDKFQWTNSNAR